MWSNSGNFVYLKTCKTVATAAEFALIPYCAPPNHKEKSRKKETLISSFGIVGANNSVDKNKKAKNNFFLFLSNLFKLNNSLVKH